MPSPDSHEHGIPLFGHLKTGKKNERREESTKYIYSKAKVIIEQVVLMSYHPNATVEQRSDEPAPCH